MNPSISSPQPSIYISSNASSKEFSKKTVEDLMLSCRVQGKRIERALFAYLVDKGDTGIDLLEIVFNETDRNGPASAVLDELGFERTKEGVRQIAVTDRLFETDVITIERRQSETGGDSL